MNINESGYSGLIADAAEQAPKGFYRHFKGGLYEVVDHALHSETLEPLVVYRAQYGERGLWVRPISMWNEVVERNGSVFRRFTFLGEERPPEGSDI